MINRKVLQMGKRVVFESTFINVIKNSDSGENFLMEFQVQVINFVKCRTPSTFDRVLNTPQKFTEKHG